MVSFKTVTAICLGATLCTAQTIAYNISGIVVDTADVGIAGATVNLEEAGISTTTGADGSFILADDPSKIQQNVNNRPMAADPIQLQNGRIAVTLSENAPVTISICDVNGRQIYNYKRTYASGTHVINSPTQSAGIYLYRVTIGKESYSFKSSPFGTFSPERTAVSSSNATLAKQAKATAVIADVISVIKEGLLNYRCVIGSSDSSGIVVKMIPNAGNVTDADGNVYQSVRIGNQVWTVENLRTTKYNDGTDIPLVTDSTAWSNLGTPGYCFYNNSTDAAYQEKWGALYNWHAVNTGKLEPAGWHVPTNGEWTTLENYLIANGYNWDGTTSGNEIGKSLAAKTDWPSSSTAGAVGNDLNSNNRTGFSALPGGSRHYNGSFVSQSSYGYWWSATERDASVAYRRDLSYDHKALYRSFYSKKYGFSVRLVRD